MVDSKKIKIGFLVDSLEVDSYTADLISFVEKNKNFHTPLLIYGYGSTNNVAKPTLTFSFFMKRLNKFFQRLIYMSIVYIESKAVKRQFPNYGVSYSFSKNELVDKLLIQGKWSKSGKFLEFDKKTINLIRSKKLDCVIRCGRGILKGEILNIPRFGILSFHHGDNQVNRGGPSGFWEVLNNIPNSGFVIQKLTEELDGGKVLCRGSIMTSELWHINSAFLQEKSNFFMKEILKNIYLKNSLPNPEDVKLHGNKLFKIDSALPLIGYFFKILVPRIGNKIINILLSSKVDCWSVAFGEHNDFSKSLWRYNEIPNPYGRYFADPFVIKKNSVNYIFVEDYYFSEQKGKISVLEIKKNQAHFLGNVLEEKFHLSFPFVFEDEGDVYMIPETHQIKQVRLYKSVKFPMKWKLVKVLMNNVSAADTLVIKHSNTWFMFTNICSSGIHDHTSELHIYYSENIFSQNWKPIKSGNPVIFDSMVARNGGVFRHNNNIYRVNQIHGKGHYGKSFSVNKIKEISKTKYQETKVFEINANFKNKIKSTHHFNANHEIAVVDFCREKRLKTFIID